MQLRKRGLEPLVQQGVAVELLDPPAYAGLQEADRIEIRPKACPEQQMIDLAAGAIAQVDPNPAFREADAADPGLIRDPDPADDSRPQPLRTGRAHGSAVHGGSPARGQ